MSVVEGRVKVPVVEMVDMIGEVKVLLVKVSVVALPINVSVVEGNVKVTMLMIDEIVGVIIVGEALITNVEPVPVCELTDVVLPTDVIGPVKLAFVVTVDAFPERVAVMTLAEKLPEASLIIAVEAVLVLVKAGIYKVDQEAAVVPDVNVHVKMVADDPIIVVIVLLPELWTVTIPVELFTI